MTKQPAGASEAAVTPRRDTGRRFIVLAAGILAIGAAALTWVPTWLPLIPGSENALIHFERAQRRFRAGFGLPMPGEPDLGRFPQRLAASGVSQGAPILIRIYKREFELELWMQRGGVFHRFTTYPICRWSGRLGPKLQQGDRQTPEGFYTVDASSLNPNSRWYRSFNLGYPNAYDRAKNRTGSFIMVHGGCGSIGCFAMTNPQMGEIWQLVTAALVGGQKRFQVQVFPFRMFESRLAEYAHDPDAPFWNDLKAGSDLFEARRLPPKVTVCEGRYRFEPGEPGSTGESPIEDRCPAGGSKS